MEYSVLEQSLTDMIKEEQAKLGYRKEVIRLYYPLGTLGHFFEVDVSAEQMLDMLKEFPAYVEKRFGKVEISHKEEQFCFILPKEASEYVHNHMAEDEFIKRLVSLVGKHGCTKEEIISLFQSCPERISVESVDNGEFDYVIRFLEGEDRYYYCFKDEGAHIIYHRFLPEDYKDFGF